tara:strand:- start:3893 stop:4945 length:1053 start_codon:yes stop_codon:yes gene_type:complete
MNLYDQYVLDPFHTALDNDDRGIPIPMPKLSKYTNYIEKAQNVFIGGKQTSGKTSYMDYMYFINLFMWWEKLDINERPPLKLIYFSMKSNTRIKLQKWACTYLKLKYDIVIDIPTLNNGIGKLYEVDGDRKKAVEAATSFFALLEDHLELVTGEQTASAIYNTVKREMLKSGTIDESGNYHLNKDKSNQITMVYIDNTDKVIPESDGNQSATSEGTKRRMAGYINKFKNHFGVTTVAVVPSVLTSPRTFKDSEPSYKELGYYSEISDLGLITYNPFNENNLKYLGYDIAEFSFNNKVRIRTVSIVRNIKGVENVTVACAFLGECGYFRELPSANQTGDLERFMELLSLLD